MIKPRSHFLLAGFTLAELLVTVTVLSIIVVTTSQILAAAAALTTVHDKHMDANDQARTVFDRMANDFARMIKRPDVDYIFWKPANASPTTKGINDTMYFFTEGASYFDNSTFVAQGIPPGATSTSEQNAFSVVGYRVNNTTTSSTYNQLERLGLPLSWDGGDYSVKPNNKHSGPTYAMSFLTYPPAGTDSGGVSSAFDITTLAGDYPEVGTESGNYNDGDDTTYDTYASQVFRLECSFQLKDGTLSDKPVMVASTTNGIPSSTLTATQHPMYSDDSTTTIGSPIASVSIGSRWWDKTNHIGYICTDPTPGYAVWHEIGIQDIAAIIVTIAVIDKQGLVFANSRSTASNSVLNNLAVKLPDYVATTTTSTVTGDPAYLLDPANANGWANALLPGKVATTMTAPKLPQTMVSQIRLYQRYFYLNSF
jgi:prepilin-type N-terminal cleavage/methylation domain-containing protein